MSFSTGMIDKRTDALTWIKFFIHNRSCLESFIEYSATLQELWGQQKKFIYLNHATPHRE
jgi:hypothetical protein